MTSNRAEHVNKGPIVLGITLGTIILAAFAVATRLFVRLRLTKAFGWDDSLLLAAFVLAVSSTVFNILMVRAGAGRHQAYLTPLQIQDVLKWNTIYEIFNIPCVCLVKLSILLFIIRINNARRLQILIWTIGIVLVVTNLMTVLVISFQCIPLEAVWNESVKGRCIGAVNVAKVGYAQGAVSVLTDLFCSGLPAYILWNVRIKLRLKIIICGLTTLGLGATAGNLARNVYFSALDSHDFTYDIWVLFICALLEQNLGIIAASVVTFRPLFKMFGLSSNKSGASGSRVLGIDVQGFPNASKLKGSRLGYDNIELLSSSLGSDLDIENQYKSVVTGGHHGKSPGACKDRVEGMITRSNPHSNMEYPTGLDQRNGILRTTTFVTTSQAA